MPNLVYLNSKYIPFKDAKIPIEDRGFQFSDSVYEVVKIINKKMLDFDFHMRRLKYSTSELNFNLKVNSKLFKKIFQNLIIKNKLSNLSVIKTSIYASIVFFLITNFSVWSFSTVYPNNIYGLLICYYAGIPFFFNTLLGNIFFSFSLFGIYEIVSKRKFIYINS